LCCSRSRRRCSYCYCCFVTCAKCKVRRAQPGARHARVRAQRVLASTWPEPQRPANTQLGHRMMSFENQRLSRAAQTKCCCCEENTVAPTATRFSGLISLTSIPNKQTNKHLRVLLTLPTTLASCRTTAAPRSKTRNRACQTLKTIWLLCTAKLDPARP